MSKIFDYNLPYLQKVITVNRIIHWPLGIWKILFFVLRLESQPVWAEEQHMGKKYKGNLRKGERLNKLQKSVFFDQFKCQPCLSYLLLGASIVMGIQWVFHRRLHPPTYTRTHAHTHTHILQRCSCVSLSVLWMTLHRVCKGTAQISWDCDRTKATIRCIQKYELFNSMHTRMACVSKPVACELTGNEIFNVLCKRIFFSLL